MLGQKLNQFMQYFKAKFIIVVFIIVIDLNNDHCFLHLLKISVDFCYPSSLAVISNSTSTNEKCKNSIL